MADTLNITLNLAGRNYKLKISSDKESLIRKSVAEINTIIDKYKSNFPNQKDIDYLSMAIIEFVGNQAANSPTNNTEIISILQDIDKQLD